MRALIIFLIALVVFAMPSIAEDGWTNYLSSTGVFKTRLPTGHKTALNSFLIGDKLAASHEETAGAIDQRPYKDVLMNYIVKFDQTIGPSLNEKELPILLDQEVSTYENYYKTSFAGTTQENKKLNLPGANGVDLTMAFQDPKLGARTIRARILFTPSTRLEQIAMGPADTIHSIQVRDFFDSLKLQDGFLKTPDVMKDKWKPIASPLNIFSVHAPDLTPPFYTQSPIIKHNENSEKITLIFNDPLRAQSVFYNIYGYKFVRALTPEDAQKFVTQTYIAPNRSAQDVTFKSTNLPTGIQTLEASYDVTPSKIFPYVNAAKLKVTYKDNIMIVQEIMSSQILDSSDFANHLMDMVDFHPELYDVGDQKPIPAPKAPVAPVIAQPTIKPPASPAPATH